MLRMSKVNSIETLNKYLDLSDQTKFRLNEINEIEDLEILTQKFEKEKQ